MAVRTVDSFTEFAADAGNRVRQALVALFGPDVGGDATAEALAYGWEHWERVSAMSNPSGYLFVIGRNWGRRHSRRRIVPGRYGTEPTADRWYEPELPRALAGLTKRQRISVLLVHGYGWTLQEVSDVLDISRSTVQKHVEAALSRLRSSLGVAR